jgi:MFS transporter, FSR family, fosmidomycin resistance protein
MNLLRQKTVVLSALGHLSIDILAGAVNVLLTFLSVPLGMSNALLGVASALFTISGSLTQPLFGHIADRLGGRRLVIGGLAWFGGLYLLGLWLPGWATVVLVIVASLGGSAFHPAGFTEVLQSSAARNSGKVNSAGSIFLVAGMTGFFLGPLAAGALLGAWGVRGMSILPAFVLLLAALSFWFFKSPNPSEEKEKDPEPSNLAAGVPAPATGFVLPVLLMVGFINAMQGWAQQNMFIFLPKYLADLGQPAALYGFVTALFAGFFAIGNLSGGYLADRIGRRRVMLGGVILASIPFFLIDRVGLSAWVFVLVPLAGLFSGAPYGVTVVLTQDVIPGGRAAASGWALGFTFTVGALGVIVSGLFADRFGLQPIFALNAALCLAAAVGVALSKPAFISPNANSKSQIAQP